MHTLGYHDVGARGQVLTRMLVELVTHSQAPNSGKNGDVFVDRVPMRGKLSAGGRSNAKHEWRSLLGRIALDYRDFGLTQRESRRRWTVRPVTRDRLPRDVLGLDHDMS